MPLNLLSDVVFELAVVAALACVVMLCLLQKRGREHLWVVDLDVVLGVRVRVESHLFGQLASHLLQELALVLSRLELLVHDLKRVAHRVVLTLEGSEARQDLVVDALDQNHFLKGVVVLGPGLVVLEVPGVDAFFNDLVSIRRTGTRLLRGVGGEFMDRLMLVVFRRRDIHKWRLLDADLLHLIVAHHEILQELGRQADSVFHLRLLIALVVPVLLLEKDGEPWEPVEPLWAEKAEVCSVHYFVILTVNNLGLFDHASDLFFLETGGIDEGSGHKRARSDIRASDFKASAIDRGSLHVLGLQRKSHVKLCVAQVVGFEVRTLGLSCLLLLASVLRDVLDNIRNFFFQLGLLR